MRRVLWLLLFWQAFYLGIFLPGHQRGGYGTVGKDSCCATPETQQVEESCCKPSKGSPEKTPTEDQKRRCLVCYNAVGVSIPPVFVFDFAFSGTAFLRRSTTTPQVSSIAFDLPYYPVGPPTF